MRLRFAVRQGRSLGALLRSHFDRIAESAVRGRDRTPTRCPATLHCRSRAALLTIVVLRSRHRPHRRTTLPAPRPTADREITRRAIAFGQSLGHPRSQAHDTYQQDRKKSAVRGTAHAEVKQIDDGVLRVTRDRGNCRRSNTLHSLYLYDHCMRTTPTSPLSPQSRNWRQYCLCRPIRARHTDLDKRN